MGLDHRPDEGRDRVLWFTDRQVDGGLARLDVGQKLMQPHERRAAFGLQRGRGCSMAVAAVMNSRLKGSGIARRTRRFPTIGACEVKA